MELCGDEVLDQVLVALLAMQRQSWEQGVAAQALLDLGLDELALLLAGSAADRQRADGRLGQVEGEQGAVNGAACGEVVLRAALLTGQPRWAAAAEAQLGWLVDRAPRAADGTLFHLLGGRQVWADTGYMVVPFLALAGRADLAVLQVEGHRRRLYDEHSALYAARWDEDSAALNRPEHWGTGNGWVVSGISRMLHPVPELPADVRDRLGRHAREVLDACLTHRRADGLFSNILDNPGTFREANVAQMLAYTALTGAADGWLPASYADTGRDLLAAADRQVDRRGLVTEVCGSPDFEHQGTSPEAQAFHLLAHAALRRLDGRPAGTALGLPCWPPDRRRTEAASIGRGRVG